MILGANEEGCFGFKLGSGDEWGMLINSKIQLLPINEIINTLIENIQFNTNVTISIGFTNYDADSEESFNEWHIRANKYLKNSKENGKNRACWGQDIKKLIKRAQSKADGLLTSTMMIEDNKEDDLITLQSLQNIQV